MKRSAPLLLALGAIVLAAACGQDTQTESMDASRRPNSSSSGGTGSSSSGSSSSNGGASSNGGTTSSGGPSGSSGSTSSSSGSHASSSSSSGSVSSSSSGGARPSSSSSSGSSSGASSSSGATSSSSGSSGAPGGTCGSGALNTSPFGCTFAWGTNDSAGGSLSGYSYLQFMSKWVGYEVKADGSIGSCDGASWLANQVASTNLIPVYYAYFIGYLGHANGFQDGNVNPNGPNLTTGGANLIRNNRAKIVEMYRYYAQQSAKVWKTKPLVWLLEGDMVQYSASTQQNPLSYAELAQLAADITCAIKSSMPNAVVAINHSTWNPNDVTNSFWGAMKSASVAYDLAWTTGAANANGFFDAGTNASSYHGATATYAYLHKVSGRPIFVDTSFGLSAQGDTWSNGSAATINARIADGVIAANVTSVPGNYASAIQALAPSLSSTCPTR